MNIELEANEVQFILDRLGDLPSRSGCFPLIVKIQSQAQAQTKLPKDEAA
jgi:hypothetical protein